jgi:CO/xanthine dehydrogenase FAD-binding subunit
MKPASFKYIEAPDEAALMKALAEHGDECRVLAGGQSLVPMMNFRVATPAVLVDINGIAALSYITDDGDVLRVGALTRHAAVEDSSVVDEHCPLLSLAVRYVAHRAVRNRGTLGGTVALAYPGAEIPLALTVLDAALELVSKRGRRRLPISEFIVGSLDTDLADDEYIAGAVVPSTPVGSTASFHESSRRHGDFAIAAAGVVAGRSADGKLNYLRAGISGGTGAPRRLHDFEGAVIAMTQDTELGAECRRAVAEVEVFGDHHYPEDYRRHVLAGVLERAVREAVSGKRHGH